jgi:anti-sigma factor ChrR (cupin superfamily)
MTNRLDELVALDALGLLSEDEQAALHGELTDNPSVDSATLYDAAHLALAVAPVEPPPGLRARVLAHVSAAPAATARSLGFILKHEGWQPHPLVAGIRFKQLALDEARGVATLLMDVSPGTIYPAHHHRGAEECYVVSGEVIAGGRRLTAGDFHHADAQSDHQPLYSETGCTVLLVVDARDYLEPEL